MTLNDLIAVQEQKDSYLFILERSHPSYHTAEVRQHWNEAWKEVSETYGSCIRQARKIGSAGFTTLFKAKNYHCYREVNKQLR